MEGWKLLEHVGGFISLECVVSEEGEAEISHSLERRNMDVGGKKRSHRMRSTQRLTLMLRVVDWKSDIRFHK